MKDTGMLELIARAAELSAALARYEAQLTTVLPKGSLVRCYGRWNATVACYVAEPDGSVCVEPDRQEGRPLGFTVDRYGWITVHVQHIERIEVGGQR